MKLIKGVNNSNEMIEIRFQKGWLDIVACKTENGNSRCIFRKEMDSDMSIDDMMQYFNVIVG
jgi:hypothetical protein